jgi:hypothetical protein
VRPAKARAIRVPNRSSNVGAEAAWALGTDRDQRVSHGLAVRLAVHAA